ncbi:MAG TPA: peptide deformylase [Candidatus Binatia bacterium]|nr:peptide deformylase [Candidatus Binatia bacterium]
MRLKVVQAGEEVLRARARALSPDEILSAETQRLIEDLRDTMRDAPGVGLAAPQVGISTQLAVIEDRLEYHAKLNQEQLALRERRPVPFHVLINPVIVSMSEGLVEFFEGCLSVSGYSAIVPRRRSVVVEFLNGKAEPVRVEASGWYARILQHEIDHLSGVLYTDRMHARTFSTLENLERYWKDAPVSAVREKLGQL